MPKDHSYNNSGLFCADLALLLFSYLGLEFCAAHHGHCLEAVFSSDIFLFFRF